MPLRSCSCLLPQTSIVYVLSIEDGTPATVQQKHKFNLKRTPNATVAVVDKWLQELDSGRSADTRCILWPTSNIQAWREWRSGSSSGASASPQPAGQPVSSGSSGFADVPEPTLSKLFTRPWANRVVMHSIHGMPVEVGPGGGSGGASSGSSTGDISTNLNLVLSQFVLISASSVSATSKSQPEDTHPT
jgi:hypothetical protein